MKKLSFTLLTATLTVVLVGIAPPGVSPAKKKAKEKANSAVPASVKEGQASFKKNCDMCHFTDKSDKKIGPGLKDLFKNKELPESHKPATEANVREQIEKGSPEAKPMPMPGFADKLSPAETDSLMEYLKTL